MSNKRFTNILRNQMSMSNAWGNFSLSAEIKPGAIGYLNATNGDSSTTTI